MKIHQLQGFQEFTVWNAVCNIKARNDTFPNWVQGKFTADFVLQTNRGGIMTKLNVFTFVALTTILLCCAPLASAQVGIGINIGPAPVCPYGYFDYAPYDCAPYGYYGPDWFVGGVFLGAGPWFHGPHGFFGHVDNRFDPHHGYVGPLPEHGAERFNHFHANEARDGRGNVGDAGHEGRAEHALPGFRGGAHGRGRR